MNFPRHIQNEAKDLFY